MSVTRHHDHEVVGVADDLVVRFAISSAPGPLIACRHMLPPFLVEMVVQRRQCNVRQQRGQDPALRGAGVRLFPAAEFREDPGFQERLHQRARTLVLDPYPQPVHQSRMIDFVETGFDVGLQNPAVITGLGCEMVDLGDRVLSAPFRAEPIRARLEIRLENRLEHQFQASLDHTIGDGRNTELAELPAFLRYQYPAHLHRPELTRLQQIPDLPQKRLDPNPGLDLAGSGLIDTRSAGALIRGHAFPRDHQERRVINEVEQVTETAARIPGRPQVQFGLHPHYRELSRKQLRPGHGTGIHRRI